MSPPFLLAADPEAEPPISTVARKPLVLPFIGYLLYFVGIGQIAGGVVHYPIDPSYFTRMALIGVVVFLAGTWINEVMLAPVRPSAARTARLVSGSAVLAIGVGGVSGGAQHFLDFPQRATMLIGIGLVLAFIGFAWKGSYRPRQAFSVGAVVAALAAFTFLALQPLASAAADESGHGHGSSTIEPAPAQPVTPAAPGSDTAPAPVPLIPAPEAEDAHADSGHGGHQ